MKRASLFAVLAAFAAVALLAADASAMNHPTMGRFMQRDPGSGGMMAAPRVGTAGPATGDGFLPRDPMRQYRDGMNLYEYARGAPTVYADPDGRLVVMLHGAKVSGYGFGRSIFEDMKAKIWSQIEKWDEPVIGEPGNQAEMWKRMDEVAKKNEANPGCREPIIIIGYSDGATVLRLLTKDFAAKHPRENIDYVGVIDMIRDNLDKWPKESDHRETTDLGKNILAGDNWYQRNDVILRYFVPLKGARISAPGTVANYDLSERRVADPWWYSWVFGPLATGDHPISHLDIVEQADVQQGAVDGSVTAWKKGKKP